MSWLRGGKELQGSTDIAHERPLRGSRIHSVRDSVASVSNYANTLFKQRTPNDTVSDCDPKACYDSFCKHWHQVNDIINAGSRKQINNHEDHRQQQTQSMHDDVLAVVSHLDYMITLLLVDLQNYKQSKHIDQHRTRKCDLSSLTPCLRYLISEDLLEKLYKWSCTTGRYTDAVYLEHCKLYELLLSQSRYQLLYHEEFLKPLIKLLMMAANDQRNRYPANLEKHLVTLLNHLCVVLMQDVSLLDEFFVTNTNNNDNSFIVYDILISYVHRDGNLGQQAREALLLCMLFSQKNERLATFIAERSSMCALLVTGLGGLYSRLPKFIETNSIECHRIMPDDVNIMPDLILFMNALEFCNAIVQAAHDTIKAQMLDFIYQGFIISVLAPTILQESVNDQISTMLYIELIFRSVTETGLLKLFIKFLLDANKCDGIRILDVLIERLNSTDSSLSVAAMVLFDTLLSLHCEDLLLELVLKYLISGKHVPLSSRYKINKTDTYADSVSFLLNLTPDIMSQDFSETTENVPLTQTQRLKRDNGLYSSVKINVDSVYGDYRAYLFEANVCIAQCAQACSTWSNSYRLYKWPQKRNNNQQHHRFLDLMRQLHEEFDCRPENSETHQQSTGNAINEYSTCATTSLYDDKKQLDSLQSLGESSGYESFRWRAPNEDEETVSLDLSLSTMEKSPTTQAKDSWRLSKQQQHKSDCTESDFSQESYSEESAFLGPFLNAIWSKLQTFTSNNLFVNLHLTGLITRLAWYPFTVVHSVLLRPDIIITSQMPSFHQILAILKQQIDAELPITNESLEIVNVARLFLLEREDYLLKIRKGIENKGMANDQMCTVLPKMDKTTNLSYDQTASNHPKTFSTIYDSFRRRNGKSRNIGQSIANIFSRKTNATTVNKTSRSTQKVSDENIDSRRNVGTPTTVNNRKFSFRETSLTGDTLTSTERRFQSLPSNISIEDRSNTHIALRERQGNFQNSTNRNIQKYKPTNVRGSDNVNDSINDNQEKYTNNNENRLRIEKPSNRNRDLALCAVLLDEWLKELAAIAQEQSIVMIHEHLH